MKRPSIGLSLTGTIAGLFAITATLAFLSIGSMRTIDRNSGMIVEHLMPSLANSQQVNVALGDLRLALRDHILADTPQEFSSAEDLVAKARADISSAMDAYAKVISEPAERAELDDFRQTMQKYFDAADELLAHSRAGRNTEAQAVLQSPAMKVLANRLNTIIDGIVAESRSTAVRQGDANQQVIQTAIQLAIVLSGAAVLIGILSIYLALSQVARPIRRITGAMANLAKGDTVSVIPFADRTDEVGSMAGAVEVFRQAAIANKRMEAEAEAARVQSEADRIADQKQAEADATVRLQVATSGLAAGLQRLASGDLAFQLTEAFAPEFEALRHDFNTSVSQLGSTLSAIAESISTMDSGTREISAGADDLSKRTEQQAASLEETAAALDEITANVNASTKRTSEARSVATQANDGAVSSAKVVSHAEEAMERIEGSSQQISNIIGVIDEIAFQTNLLALNAGVEAARAGDAGKGFAVVAQEVRELAQRSAQAAKEIKGLIQSSSNEVQNGVRLVRDASLALNTIGNFITEINTHVEAIATSAREQSLGLAEVNQAVNALDQTTQQNAAMVEQSTAASASLAVEAGKLRDLVSQFKLGGATGQTAALRQTAGALRASGPGMAAPAPAQAPVPTSTSAQTTLRRRPAVQGNAALARASWEEF
ncbi:methyl-accepting chemotaxis protein [Rhizobium sp. Leaf341]|uniref:methyl-accepting chemotaxis protein n=1 Tax=Rhizobium sp. Leaf341 TaxID=1736344 RepID=UPI0009E774B3|nr:HAMP domain-containing methyl-accepting chemotaxis protein [Rhizobium sp. Leaf341]